jgi:hypothetical protein
LIFWIQKVPVATIGTVLYDKEGNPFTIKKGKIRGQESHGMICAEDELGLGESHDGIMILDETLVPGTKAATVFKIENDEVYVYRIYSGTTIEDLTVLPLELLDRVGITGLTEYEMGYLNSYFYQIYQSGEIE